MASFTQPIALTSAPSEYSAQQQAIQRRAQLTQSLLEQGQEPLQTNQTAGGYVIPISPLQGLAKALQAGLGAYGMKQQNQDQMALAQKYQGDLQDTFGRAMAAASAPQSTLPPDQSGPPAPNPMDQASSILMSNPATQSMGMQLGQTRMQMMLNQALLAQMRGQTGGSVPTAQSPGPSADAPAFPSQADAASAGQLGAPTAASPPPSGTAAQLSGALSGQQPTAPPSMPSDLLSYLSPTDQNEIIMGGGGIQAVLAEASKRYAAAHTTVVNRGFGTGTRGLDGQYVPDAASTSQAALTAGAVAGSQAQARSPWDEVNIPQLGGGPAIPMSKANAPGFGNNPPLSLGGSPGLPPPSGIPQPSPSPVANTAPASFGPGVTPASANEPVSGPPQSVPQLPTEQQPIAQAALAATAAGKPFSQTIDPMDSAPKLSAPAGAGSQPVYQAQFAKDAAGMAVTQAQQFSDASNTANLKIATNNQALALLDKADTGSIGPTLANMKNVIASIVPGISDADFGNRPSDSQALYKDLSNAALQKGRSLFGSRFTNSEVGIMMNQASPSPLMAKEAIRFLLQTDNATNQYAINQGNYYGNYIKAGNDPTQFNNWYAKQFPLTDALSQVQMGSKPAAVAGPSAQDVVNEMRKRGLIK